MRKFLRRDLGKLAALALFLVLAGLMFSWSGLYNVAATAAHFPLTAWLLHFTMRNSVETHALPLRAPPLDDPALIERGAGHYEIGCSPCHGAPGKQVTRIPKNMLPEPPYLPPVLPNWKPEELFWIVRHGLKYTGMPAWPAPGREDEVWAVTAFLLRLSSLSPEDYVLLAKGDRAGSDTDSTRSSFFSGAAPIEACADCHGVEGGGRPSGAFPRLDGQSPDYLLRALSEYASGERPSGIMQPLAAMLSEDERRRLAHHYAEAQASALPSGVQHDPAILELGRRIAAEGIPARDVAPCAACHGSDGHPENPLFPALAGQYAAYTRLQLKLWKERRRGSSSYAKIMEPIVWNMTDDEMAAVAEYYESLKAPPHHSQ